MRKRGGLYAWDSWPVFWNLFRTWAQRWQPYPPAMLLAFAQAPEMGLYVILLYVAIQQLEGNFLTPVIQARAVDLPPVLTLIATFVMGALFGVLGLFVATPLAAVALVLVRMLYREDVLGDTVRLPGRTSASSPDVEAHDQEEGRARMRQ